LTIQYAERPLRPRFLTDRPTCDANARTSGRERWRARFSTTTRSRKQYPGLIYVSHKGFFLRGPYEKRLAPSMKSYDYGGPFIHDGAGRRPLRAGAFCQRTSWRHVFVAIGVLAALRERERATGQGQGRCRSATLRESACPQRHRINAAIRRWTREPPGRPMPSLGLSPWSVLLRVQKTEAEGVTALQRAGARKQVSSRLFDVPFQRPRILPAEPALLPTNALPPFEIRPRVCSKSRDAKILKDHRRRKISPASSKPAGNSVRADRTTNSCSDDPPSCRASAVSSRRWNRGQAA